MPPRFIPLGSLLAPLILIGLAAPASANTIAGGTIRIDIMLPDGEGGFRDPVGTTEKAEFFNQTACVCGTQFGVELTLEGATGTSDEEVELWVGTSCDTAADREARLQQCKLITTFTDADTLKNPQVVAVDTGDLMFPGEAVCSEETATRGVFALVDDDNDNDATFLCTFTEEIEIDTQPPGLPQDPTASAGEGAVVITWDAPAERDDDVFRYQALCRRADGSWSDDDGFPRDDPAYQTYDLTCPESGVRAAPAPVPHAGGPDAGPEPDAGRAADAAVGGPDGGSTTPPATGFEGLDPMFVCGTATQGETSMRINGLENGVTYEVKLLTIDQAQNAVVSDLGQVTPAQVKDFWEDYHDKGGSADGGICLVNTTYGDNHPFTTVLRDFRDGTLAKFAIGRWMIQSYYDYVAPFGAAVESSIVLRVVVGTLLLPVVGTAAVWQYGGIAGKLLVMLAVFGLVRLRRRRRTRTPKRSVRRPLRLAAAATAALLVIGAFGGVADARPYNPYWDAFDDPNAAVGDAPVRWNVGIKLGPYVPGIDDEFDVPEGEKGPFETMFRGRVPIMGLLELDRFFWYPAGQLGVTGSLGYTSKTASSYAVDGNGDVIIDPDTMEPERSASDKTKFRMLPASIGLVYRFTALDDKYGIPVVPYGKLGLSYYLWWITNPAGDIAEAPDMDCPDLSADCDGDKALGASLGVQATIGIAIRAERIDKQAARNMRNESGIYHAGFYAELTWAKVDGFGADGKLNVGTLTWFAGINFEF